MKKKIPKKIPKTNKNDNIKKAIISSLRNGSTISAACEAAGSCRDRFYEWGKIDKQFKEDTILARESRICIVEDALYKKAISGNTTGVLFSIKALVNLLG